MIRLRVLASLELSSADGRELQTVLAQPKRAALLAYLAAASPPGFHQRDRLLALFWPDVDDAHARDALNTAVRFLRRELGRAAIANRGQNEIGIERTECWTDVSAFRSALDAGRYEEAMSLYRGDLLDGFFTSGAGPFEQWLERTRAQLRAGAAKAARALAEQRERDEKYTTAVSCARRAVELSDGDERMLRQLLEMLERLGDRAGAVTAYEAFERRLATELETEPAAETRALIARIRSRAPVAASPQSTPFATSEPSSGFLPGWRVERELGRGGMATVYLARDAAHDRYVALKVMRPELVLSAGVEYFLREIQITARLAHPHIQPLIDSGARDGVPYLVTPYVAGESLRARLRRERTLPVNDALRIATEIAEALDYAHRSGVLHRDVKPENILLADGHAVVADFGIARALVASGATPTPRSVEDGAIVGSLRYMSPEQAAGDANVDARTDLYSLGCVLFEMLAGEVFEGPESAGLRLARRREVPAAVWRLVVDCLAREPERRPPSAAHLLRRLEDMKPRSDRSAIAAKRRTRRILVASGAALAVTLLASYVVSPLRGSSWSSVSMGPTRKLTYTPGLEMDPAISPDGNLIAYAAGKPGRTRIYVRPISGGDAVVVSGESVRSHRWPSWSPDGSQIAFLASESDRTTGPGRVFIVPALGGPRRTMADGLSFFATPAWSSDGNYVAYPLGDSLVIRSIRDTVARVFAAHPPTRRSATLNRGSSMWAAHSLAWSPDGRRLAFVSGNPAFSFGTTAFGNLGPSSIWTVALDGRPPTRLTTAPFTFGSPVFTPDNRGILYVSNAEGGWDVYHQAIDAAGRPRGEPRRLTSGLNAHGISLSRDGSRLAYTQMDSRSNIFAASTTERRLDSMAVLRQVTDENQTIETVDVSKDGKWLVFESNRDGRSHIYKMPAAGGELVQLTNDPEEDFAPRWSPDGRWIAFHRREPSKDGLRDVYLTNADGRSRTRLTTDTTFDNSYPVFTADSRRVVFNQVPPVREMVSTLGLDGRWAEPKRDSVSESVVAGYRVSKRGGDLYVQPEGGKTRLLVSARELGGLIFGRVAHRSPNGSVVYARVEDSTGVHSFYSVPVVGGKPRLVTRHDGPARIIFSAGPSHLYFTLTRAESDIYLVALRK